MKKTIVAAAVAGAFVAPTAMAAEGPSVNIYYPQAIVIGDTEDTNGANSTATESLQAGGGSRLMFNWTDNLNNGMTLGAYMSLNTFNHNTAGGISSRNSNINLTGEFGTIAMGTNEHFFEIDAITDGYGADWALTGASQGGEGLNFQQIGASGFNFTRRDENSVWWTGPQMNNLQLRAAYIFGLGADDNDAADPEGYQIGAVYNMGGLNIKAAYAKYEDYAVGSNNTAKGTFQAGSSVEGTQFIFGYDFGSFSSSIGIIDMEQDTGTGNLGAAFGNGTRAEVNGYFVNFTMPVEGGRVILNIGELGDQDIDGAAQADSGISGMDIGYQHDLSANTYAFVRYQTSETGANFDATAGDTDASSFMGGFVFSY
jgi:hypothetical protein